MKRLTHLQVSSQNLRRILFVNLICIAAVLFFAPNPIANAQNVHIPDPALRMAIELALGKHIDADITPAEMASLKWLDAPNAKIENLIGLEFAINLETLDLSDNRISDISPLKGLTNLRYLYIRSNYISDISPLKGLTNLSILYMPWNDVSDISALKDLMNLSYFDIGGNDVSDVSPLKDLTNLRELWIGDNDVSDLSPLKDSINLTTLDLHINGITDISPLKNLRNLRELRLYDNLISDISPLKDLTNLKHLNIANNRISDFSPLAGVIDNLDSYHNDGQTAPSITVRAGNVNRDGIDADVNRDGTVNITDVALIVVHFNKPNSPVLAVANIYPDVNEDGQVDIEDLVAVVAELGTAAAAPALTPNALQASNITAENLAKWIRLAKQLETQTLKTQKGIAVLEQLLIALNAAEGIPQKTRLLANYPNPFNPETWIPYQLAKPAAVTLFIHAADGSLVRTLQLGTLPAGVYQSKTRAAYWDGKNDLGEPVASGLYFYTLTTRDYTATGKMLIRK